MTTLDEAQSRAPTAAIREFLRNSISLADVMGQIWSGRLIVAIALVLGVAVGLYQAHHDGPRFLATISVMPSQSDTDGGGGGAIGMLASLTGGGGGGTQVSKFTQFLSSLGSVGVAEVLERKYDSVCIIYRGLCDPKTHIWRERTGIDAMIKGLLARVAGLPDPNGPLTAVDLAQYNMSSIVVIKDKTSGLVTLDYNNRDAKFAADYLSKVVRTTNDYIRDQDRTNQRTYVDYVAHRISTNTNVAQREALDGLLLQEERKLMMTEVDVPYAAAILDGPTVVPLNRVLRTVALDAILGLFIGVVIAYLRRYAPALRRRLPF